jgi:hypothetical protein
VKIQLTGHVSKKEFVYRYRVRGEHLGDVAVVSNDYIAIEEPDIWDIEAAVVAQSGTRTPNSKCSTAHWAPSRRHVVRTINRAGPEDIPNAIASHGTTAVGEADAEIADDTANVGSSEGNSQRPLPRRRMVGYVVRESTRPGQS